MYDFNIQIAKLKNLYKSSNELFNFFRPFYLTLEDVG